MPFDLWWPPSDSYDFRVTLTGGKLTLAPYNEYLLDSAAVPKHGVIAGQDVCIANLKVLRGVREIVVSFVSGAQGRAAATRILGAYAATAGYTRLWVEDGLVELDPERAPSPPPLPACPTCKTLHASWSQQWWASVKQAGIYPLPCLACGSWVPQWDEGLLG